MINAFLERKSLDWESPQAQMLDLQFHDVRPEKGLAYLLERQGKLRRLVSDEEIVRAITEPPEDTRAYFRGQCLKRYGDAVFGVNWDSISFGIGDEPIKRVMMAEPLKGSKAHVQDLLDRALRFASVALFPDVGHVQERGALQADVDEGRLHPRQHTHHAPHVDIAHQAAALRALDVQFLHRAQCSTATRVSAE
jgi:hypothetical protein